MHEKCIRSMFLKPVIFQINGPELFLKKVDLPLRFCNNVYNETISNAVILIWYELSH